MKENTCKFCGRKIAGEKYLRPEQPERSCGICTAYCMKKCELNRNGLLSWHSEPCKSCNMNPYKLKTGDVKKCDS